MAAPSQTANGLPEYSEPPVIEVALSVQFDQIHGLDSAHVGLLWQRFKDNYPVTQDHPPLLHATEEFGARATPGVSIEASLVRGPLVPRVWFLNESGSGLVQVQQDRFALNWRQVAGDEYPRYVTVRDQFDEALSTFRDFLGNEGLGDISPDQCEVTYVNHVVPGEIWKHHGDVQGVVSVWSGAYSDEFLADPEEVRFVVRYVMTDKDENPLGRLHVSLEPAYTIADGSPVLVLKLIARGAPTTEGIDGVGEFLDLGHEWIVRGFTSITTGDMHAVWERRYGH